MKAWQSQLTVNAIEVLAEDIHEWAKGKGFWDEDRNDGECIALMHSELSEALESIRHGSPADHHCPEFSNTEIEFADCLIRILDTCKARGYRVDAMACLVLLRNLDRDTYEEICEQEEQEEDEDTLFDGEESEQVQEEVEVQRREVS